MTTGEAVRTGTVGVPHVRLQVGAARWIDENRVGQLKGRCRGRASLQRRDRDTAAETEVKPGLKERGAGRPVGHCRWPGRRADSAGA